MFQKIKSFLFNFFHFNKQERNGVFVLCCIILLVFSLRLLMPFFYNSSEQIQFSSEIIKSSHLDSFEINQTSVDLPEKKLTSHQSTNPELFIFDPNTVSFDDAQKLGFSKKLSLTLVNFRNKGGKFFKPEDLKKLYGLSSKLYENLEPYILISSIKSSYKRDSVFFNSPRNYEKKNSIKSLVELNTADSLSIVYLKGIGPGFTKRILKYRAMLGGFHSINQLKEVYGMTDSTFVLLSSQIKLDAYAIQKIPINTIDFNSLRRHPYFNFQSAQAIINFRLKHGKLSEVDIKGLGVFSDEKLNLILPYLSY